MKKIVIKNIKKLLLNLEADDSIKELIINNVELYNDLVKEYHDENTKHNAYLMYQLNNQIIKQIESIKKTNKKINVDKKSVKEKYPYDAMMTDIKKNFETRDK